jgi:imidazole glycerol phosphate synthase glutamine amidotransferase subunit
MIAIFDYGAGNLRSVQNTLDEIGVRYEVVNDAAGLKRGDKIILPGVGHFGQMMRALDTLAVREALLSEIKSGKPFLGICLGLQALFGRSAEAPDVQGLGYFNGEVQRFPLDARVPHMGWNDLRPKDSSRLIKGHPYLYFAHSYYCPLVESTSATCEYSGVTYTAVLETGNVCGVQFHPEKSGPAGLEIVKRFVEC